MGVVVELKERPLKSGKGRWAVAILEDRYGQVEVLCFSKAYEDAVQILSTKEPVLLTGRVLFDDEDEEGNLLKPKIRLIDVRLLSEAQIARASLLLLDFTQIEVKEEMFHKICELLRGFPGEKPVDVRLKVPHQAVVTLRLKERVHPNDVLIHRLQEIASGIDARRI